MSIPTKFSVNIFNGFIEENLNVKVYRRRRTQSDDNSSHDLKSKNESLTNFNHLCNHIKYKQLFFSN